MKNKIIQHWKTKRKTQNLDDLVRNQTFTFGKYIPYFKMIANVNNTNPYVHASLEIRVSRLLILVDLDIKSTHDTVEVITLILPFFLRVLRNNCP